MFCLSKQCLLLEKLIEKILFFILEQELKINFIIMPQVHLPLIVDTQELLVF
jgi:hypothetical protein